MRTSSGGSPAQPFSTSPLHPWRTSPAIPDVTERALSASPSESAAGTPRTKPRLQGPPRGSRVAPVCAGARAGLLLAGVQAGWGLLQNRKRREAGGSCGAFREMQFLARWITEKEFAQVQVQSKNPGKLGTQRFAKCPVWWPTPLVPALRRQRQADPCKFKTSLVSKASY